jgi:hypothetical protein
MYEWVRALLDPTEIVQSPSSAKKQITPPPKFEIPDDEPAMPQRNRRGRSASPSKKSSSPRKSRTTRITKDVTSTPSTTAANASLQSALDITASALDTERFPEFGVVDEAEAKANGSPEKKTRGRKSKRSATEEPEEQVEETKEEKKEKKKAEKKEKKKDEIKEQEEPAIEISVTTDATDDAKPAHTTVSLEMPTSLAEVPSAAETEEMIAQAKSMVEEAIKAQADNATAESTSVKLTKKRKPEEDEDEETSAESSQRAKRAKVLEDKLKQERVRNRSIFGVSVAFALAYVICSTTPRSQY